MSVGRKPGTPGKQGRAPVPTRKQFNIALQRCEGYPHALRNKALLAMLFGLGLRPKEASSLCLSDVYDFKAEALLPELTLLKAYTKRGKVRMLPLNNELVTEHMARYIEFRKGNPRHYRPEAPLILSQRGGPFTANSLGNLANELLQVRASISKACTYSGRRFFATTLVRNRVDLRTIQRLMGHSSLATTQIYIESDPVMMADATKGIL